jgi:hypothetical protein
LTGPASGGKVLPGAGLAPLKQAIRARAARTGERYTTARRHVLNELQSSEAIRPTIKLATKRSSPISDDKIAANTGHGLDHWFAVLDRFGGAGKGHTAMARHLYESHAVEGWYAQGITVAYERARGVRVANQRCDGAFEVSASKTMPGALARLVK